MGSTQPPVRALTVLWPAFVMAGVAEMLDFAEFLLAKRDREMTEAWSTLDKYAGRYDGGKWRREELYDRAGLR